MKLWRRARPKASPSPTVRASAGFNPDLRLTAPPYGREARVEVRDRQRDEWVDVSPVVRGADARVRVDEVTTIGLDVVAVLVDVEGVATEETLAAFESFAGRARWRFPRAPRFAA